MNEYITHEGVKYRKVDRVAEEGETVLVVYPVGNTDYENGDVFNVIEAREYDVVIIDNANDRNALIHAEYVVLEPVTQSLDDIASELAEAKRKIGDLEEALEQAKKTEEPTLKAGDYAKVVGSNHTNYFGGKDGDIVKIVAKIPHYNSSPSYRVEELNGGDYEGNPFADEGALVPATDEEVAEAKRKITERETDDKWAKIGRKPGEFKKGDIAQIIVSQNGLPVGRIFEVQKPLGEISVLTEGGYGANVDCIKLIAPVESIVNLTV